MKSIKEILECETLFENQTSELENPISKFENQVAEPSIHEPIVSRLAKDFGKIAFEANLKRSNNSISQRVKEEIISTALYLYQCRHKQSHKKLQILHEIEEAYTRSSALMTFLKNAEQENEISRSDFLHFEIQIKLEMQKMLMAIGKIMVGE
jgi:hypothetical protein